MAARSSIEWTDSTFNPWIGCTKISPACDNCYAEVSTPSRTRGVEWGANKPRRRTSPANWKLPLSWNRDDFRECGHCGWRGEVEPTVVNACPRCWNYGRLHNSRRRVFCASLADWLDNEVPAEWLGDLLDLIRCTPNLDWLLLTKRIGNWRSRLEAARAAVVLRNRIDEWLDGTPPPNVWIGATICNQAEADRDIPKLLRVSAAVRFVSIEPMLGPIRLWKLGALDFTEDSCGAEVYALSGTRAIPDCDWKGTKLDWVIAGGESGPHARPMHPDWARSLRDQCAAAGVPFLFKQWGEWAPSDHYASEMQEHYDVLGRTDGDMVRVGKKAAGRLLDGVAHDGYPVRR